jgi:hypothetical protein
MPLIGCESLTKYLTGILYLQCMCRYSCQVSFDSTILLFSSYTRDHSVNTKLESLQTMLMQVGALASEDSAFQMSTDSSIPPRGEEPLECKTDSAEHMLEVASLANKELRNSAKYYAIMTSNVSTSNPSGGTGVSIEYRLLRHLSNRLMTESSHYRLHSRYTRSICQLLLEVLSLRRTLTGVTPYRYLCYIVKYILMFILMIYFQPVLLYISM